MTFYNTTNEKGDQLKTSEQKTKTQDDIVMDFFQANRAHRFTPNNVQALALPDAPLTSVRRSITNMTEDGLLEKTDTKREGRYGMPNYCWRLAPEPKGQIPMFD